MPENTVQHAEQIAKLSGVAETLGNLVYMAERDVHDTILIQQHVEFELPLVTEYRDFLSGFLDDEISPVRKS